MAIITFLLKTYALLTKYLAIIVLNDANHNISPTSINHQLYLPSFVARNIRSKNVIKTMT